MLHAAPDRPIVRLAAAPAAALVRTFVIAIAIPPAGPARFLAPTEPDSLLGHVSTTSDARRAALAVARGVLALLPIPSLQEDASPLLIPAFERVPASGDPVQTVDRIVAVPIFTGTPAFDLSHDGWLHWVTLAAASSLIYVMVAHAVNRVRTYRATIPREVLDSLMSVSSRLRSGALEPRRAHPAPKRELPSASADPRAPPRLFADALAKTLAVDELLRRTLLSVPDTDPLAEQLHAYADRVQPADLTEIPPAFMLDNGLPTFSDSSLFLTPFTVRVQPPLTTSLPPVLPQPAPPDGFEPKDLKDLLTAQGAKLLEEWYASMYEYLLLVDALSPLLSISRRRRAGILRKAATGDPAALDDMISILIGDLDDDRDAKAPDVRAFVLDAAQAMSGHIPWSEVRPEPFARWPELVYGEWEALFLDDSRYNGPSDDVILRDILRARPDTLALGASCFDPRAQGIVWDLRQPAPKPVDYTAAISTHLNLDFVRAAQKAHPTYPDQEIFDHLLFGVRFKSQPEYQMILQPHLSSLPLGYENVHKELRRLRDKGFFECYKHPPFAPWQTHSNGVAFRKLEPDRPRRTTDGGSPRRGEKPSLTPSASGYYRRSSSKWMTDTDGKRVVPINSTRWPEEDLQRGTLEIFFQGWKERLRSTAGSPPPGLHPLLSFHGPGLSTPPASRPSSRPPSPLPQPPLQRRAVIIFSGAPDKPFSLSQSLRELGWLVQDFDLLEGKDAHNVLLKEPSDVIIRAAAEAHFVWMAPPCNPYSVAADHRPQLFSVKGQWWLWMAQESEGAETGRLHPAWSAYARRAWEISRFVARVILACRAKHVFWCIENPPRRDLPGVLGYWGEFADYGTLWHALNADERLAAVNAWDVTFPYCALGAPYQKVTTLRSNCRDLILAFGDLVCTHERHEGRLRGAASDGTPHARSAAAYPLAFITRACEAIDSATRARSSLHDAPPPAEEPPTEGQPESSASTRGQLSLSSRPAAPALRLGQVVDVDITRAGPTPQFANPFRMGIHGTDGRLRGLATATHRSWLLARTVRAGEWPTALPISRHLQDFTGEDVEKALHDLFERHGRACRYHFVCGARCFGKSCHGQALLALAAQILDGSADPPFARELKITVPEAMNDLAVLMHVSYLTDGLLPVIQIATDVSDFFNQHRLHPCEVPRVGLVTLDIDLLLKATGRLRRHDPEFCNVADYVLGYGFFFASQIGQRHAYLLSFLWLVEMLRECGAIVEALCRRFPVLTRWMEERRKLLEPPAEADWLDPTARVRLGQAQLFAMSMYTDDAHKKILSVELAVLGLRIWLKITSSLNLTMAIVQKQMIGQFITNQGLRFHSGFGIVYVPHDKLRRSFANISEASAGTLTLRDYHSLLGLLQSLIFVVGLRRSSTFGLWAPLSGDVNPEHLLVPSPAIRQRLEEWRSRLSKCAGASFEAGVEKPSDDRDAVPPSEARLVFVFRSDASKEGARMSGLGGCLGGRGWRYPDAKPLSGAELDLPVAVTEFAAFFGQVEQAGDEVPDDALILAEVDALATALSLTEEAAQSHLMQEVYSELQQLPQFLRIRDRLIVAHCHGDANIMADAFSRGELDTAKEICRQMGMSFDLQPSPPRLRSLMRRLARLHRASTAPGVSNPNMAPSPFAHLAQAELDLRRWREYETYLLALDDEALRAVPTPPPPSSEASREGWEPSSEGWESDREWDRSPRFPRDADDGEPRAVFTSTTLGSHNIAMDGRPVAHPDVTMYFPADYGAPAVAPETTPRASARASAAALTPIRYSLPDFQPRVAEAPASRKRPSECFLSYPDSYLHEAPPVRCPPLPESTSSPMPPGLAGLVSRMLEEDTSRLALRPTSFTLLSMCEQLYDPRRCTAARTSKGQKSAWVHWAAWCQVHNTEPWRLERFTTDTDHHREAVLQAGFINFVHLRQSARPKSGRKAALPSSAAKTLAHVRKMHKDRDFPMVASRLVQNEIQKLYMDHKSRHGVKDLIPKRKEPFTRDILLNTILGAPDATTVGRFKIVWASRSGRALRALTKTLASTGFRKSEVSVEKAGQPLCDCLTRANLSWLLRGKVFASGSAPADLLSQPQEGDFAILQPPPSKSDPFDMVWGSKPIFLPFDADPLSAFTSLADIELNDPVTGPPELTAMFTADDGSPFTGHFLDRLLHGLLLRHFPESVAKNYSWHSCRIWLATALLASGASRAQIQALCRWQTEESLNIYACLGAQQYSLLLAGAFKVRIDAARAATLADAAPFICRNDVLAATGAARALAAAPQDALDADVAPDDDADDD